MGQHAQAGAGTERSRWRLYHRPFLWLRRDCMRRVSASPGTLRGSPLKGALLSQRSLPMEFAPIHPAPPPPCVAAIVRPRAETGAPLVGLPPVAAVFKVASASSEPSRASRAARRRLAVSSSRVSRRCLVDATLAPRSARALVCHAATSSSVSTRSASPTSSVSEAGSAGVHVLSPCLELQWMNIGEGR